MGKLNRAVCAFLILLAQPAFGDKLILKDGESIETRGPWQVQGRLVVFTTSDGVLSSIRAGSVDLEKSRQASELLGIAVQQVAPVAATPSARQPIFVLTNAVLPGAATRARLRDVPDEVLPPTPAPRRSGLVVDSWAEIGDQARTGLEIIGTVSNRGGAIERVVGITVTLSPGDGRGVQSVNVLPDELTLLPGASTHFRTRLYGIGRDHGRPEFEIESVLGSDRGSFVAASALGR